MNKLLLCLRMFRQMIEQIANEAMLILLVIAPVLAGLLFKVGIPLFEARILTGLGFGEILVPYYGYAGWLLSLLSGMLLAFVGALVVLGEIDDGISKYLCVTPLGAVGYLASRIFIPAVVSGIFASIIVPVFSLVHIDRITLLIMIVSTVLSGIITSLLVIAISSNKVEGMAVGKLSGGFGMIMFVPLIIKGPVQYVFSLFPMFWIGKYIQNNSCVTLLLALVLFVGWIYFLNHSTFRRLLSSS